MAKKNTHVFLNETENYDIVRKHLHDLYLRGSKASKDFSDSRRFNESKRTTDDVLRRIKNYLNSNDTENYTIHNHPKRKQDRFIPALLHDSFQTSYNYFFDTLRQHTVSPADIIFYLYLLEIKNIYDYDPDPDMPYGHLDIDFTEEELQPSLPDLPLEGITATELHELMSFCYTTNAAILDELEPEEEHSDDFPLSVDQVQARLNELSDAGILEHSAAANDIRYRFVPDLFTEEVFDSERFSGELEDLRSLISFYCDHAPFSLPGYFLKDKVNRILKYNSTTGASSNDFQSDAHHDSFTLKTSHFHNLIDDDVLWFLTNAILNIAPVTYKYCPVSSDKENNVRMLPIKIVSELQYGRHYIFGWMYTGKHRFKQGSFVMHRVDSIYSLTPDQSIPPEAKLSFLNQPTDDLSSKELLQLLDQIYRKSIASAWNIAQDNGRNYEILLHFSFPNDWQENISRLIPVLREKGTVISLSQTELQFDFKTNVCDYAEIIPWVNSFGHYVSVDETTSPELYAAIQQTTKETLSLYESV